MQYELYYLVGIVAMNLSRAEDKFDERYSVTQFDGLEQYYVQVRRRNTMFPPPLNLSNASKSRICKQIFYKKLGFGYFFENWKPIGAKLRDVTDIAPRVRWDVNSLCMNFPCNEQTTILHEAGYEERTFICPVRNIASKYELKPYFISEYVYNLNEVPGEPHIGGRFVFVQKDEIEIFALAEEHERGYFFINLEIEFVYRNRRADKSSTAEAGDDPVCKLNASKKFRICNAITMGEIIKRHVFQVFLEDECEEKKHFSLFIDPSTVYEEWMIACRIVGTKNKIFYVSRGYAHNEVFVYKISEGRLELSFIGRKISVVFDGFVNLIGDGNDVEN